MHRCLSIQDIQWLIFSDCSPKALANLAATCKSFHDAALNRLWRSVSFVDIVRAMPPDLWTHIGPTSAVRPVQLGLRRPITTADLIAFNKYAHRVLEVTVSVDNGQLSGPFVESLSEHLPRPILPNLRSLRCFGKFEGPDYLLLSLFLGSTLEDIELPELSASQSSVDLMSDIACSAPFLRVLSMGYGSDRLDGAIADAMSDPIRQLHNLEELDVQFYPRRAMAHIAGLPKLQVLQISHLDNVVVEPLGRSSEVPEMDLTSRQSPSNFTHFISMLCPTQLRMLSLAIYGMTPLASDMSLWKQCLETLSLYCSCTLEYIRIYCGKITTETANLATFRPLLAIRSLTDVSLGGFLYDLGDDDLERMALAWPKLEFLSLTIRVPRPATAPPPRITLHGIAKTLLKHCPMLSMLGLIVDALNVDPPSVNDRADYVCNQLITKISVGDSPIGDAAEVAKFLYHILPNLEDIDKWFGDRYAHLGMPPVIVPPLSPLAQDYHSRWTNVSQMLKTLRKESQDAASEAISDHDE